MWDARIVSRGAAQPDPESFLLAFSERWKRRLPRQSRGGSRATCLHRRRHRWCQRWKIVCVAASQEASWVIGFPRAGRREVLLTIPI